MAWPQPPARKRLMTLACVHVPVGLGNPLRWLSQTPTGTQTGTKPRSTRCLSVLPIRLAVFHQIPFLSFTHTVPTFATESI